ncbi:response regulator transcription factor [Lacticaseibacillus saniviri]|uniref:Response regulator n=1 Tax=Lacticaseibacillus saniviri JCM 17471 = DSM 24301 TaxID=1293598 RepID=A0A0R2MZL6_9LACO|nr:LytTR family transcriptional regulator DNA-binding domain-containing protein [Lacticaseibacillus saniviri]KRO18913.1 hypothetical protein IV56_GL000065 [Lacticaseibacillus saniviri JCM 17471 = DSM 24301]MCG4280931.1 DNA-binding response regulator [Lacticaseibacillus saniviri]
MLEIVMCEDNTELLNIYKLIVNNEIIANQFPGDLILATSNPTDVLELIEQTPDPENSRLYILDIEFSDSLVKGLDLGMAIRKADTTAKIVFITTHDELAPTIFRYKVEPLDMIEKDRGIKHIEQELIKDMHLARERQIHPSDDQTDYFIISDRARVRRVPVFEIDYFTTGDSAIHKVVLHATNTVIEFRDTLKRISMALPQFYRLDKQTLLNTKRIASVDMATDRIVFVDGSELIGSKQTIKLLHQALQDMKH